MEWFGLGLVRVVLLAVVAAAEPAGQEPGPEPAAPDRVKKTAALDPEVVPRTDNTAEDTKSPHEAPAAESERDETEEPKGAEASGSGPVGASPGPTKVAPHAGGKANSQGAKDHGAGARQVYLARRFAYVREAIQRNATYPPLARRMGWGGRVVLAFRILADGTVANVRVAKGAGFPALDNGAIEAVRRAAPFPPPPRPRPSSWCP